MKVRRIICVGNRYAGSDETGPAVYDRLSRGALPDGVELIDGGLGGLKLLPVVEGTRRVVFVDTLHGFGAAEEPVVLDGLEAAADLDPSFGHDEGLSYLLKVLPAAAEGPLPEIRLAGLEPGASAEALDRLARTVLGLAAEDDPLAEDSTDGE